MANVWLPCRRGWNRTSTIRIRRSWFTSCSLHWASSSRQAVTRHCPPTCRRLWSLLCSRRPPSPSCRTVSRPRRWNSGSVSETPGLRPGRPLYLFNFWTQSQLVSSMLIYCKNKHDKLTCLHKKAGAQHYRMKKQFTQYIHLHVKQRQNLDIMKKWTNSKVGFIKIIRYIHPYINICNWVELLQVSLV